MSGVLPRHDAQKRFAARDIEALGNAEETWDPNVNRPQSLQARVPERNYLAEALKC